VLVELVGWGGLVGTFLFVYVNHLGEPQTAIAPHLSFIANVALGTFCVRVLIWRLLAPPVAAWANALLLATVLLLLATYYFLVFVGLQSWGRVISWALITTYASQVGELARGFGWPPASAYVGPLAILIGLAVALRILRRWLGWTETLAGALSAPVAFALVIAGATIVAARGYTFVTNSPARYGEPISLTFFSEQATSVLLQTHSTSEARTLDRAEGDARTSYAATTQLPRHNLILIIGDSLRADHMSVYGYARETTPNIAQMLQTHEGEQVAMVHSACAETSCGVLAMLGSKYVYQIPPHPFMIIEALRRNGYKAHLILGGDHTNFYGLGRAYGEVEDYYDGNNAKPQGYTINDDAFVIDRVAALPPSDGGMHYFQIHMMSSHTLGKRHDEFLKFLPASDYQTWGRPGAVRGEDQVANNYYDNGVLQFDAYVARVLASLSEKGYLQDALVVIAADHGEMLGEHGQLGHSRSVYESVLRVPLMFFRYGYSRPVGVDTRRFASLIDVAPTIAFELGIPAPATWKGVPLQTTTDRKQVFFQEGGDVGVFDLQAADQPLKYWRNLRSSNEFLYAIDSDPSEQHNLVGSRPKAEVDALRLSVLPASNVTYH